MADLRLGRYESAVGRDVHDPDVRELLTCLEQLPPAERNVESFERAAREAPDRKAALPWLDLLALAGDEEALDDLESQFPRDP